jgi:surface antigen
LNEVETGQTVAWTNPDTKSQYEVTPTKTYKDESGQDCREYTTVGIIDGKRETINGTACRQADGTWKAATEQ